MCVCARVCVCVSRLCSTVLGTQQETGAIEYRTRTANTYCMDRGDPFLRFRSPTIPHPVTYIKLIAYVCGSPGHLLNALPGNVSARNVTYDCLDTERFVYVIHSLSSGFSAFLVVERETEKNGRSYDARHVAMFFGVLT